MNRIAYACLVLAVLLGASPAGALTNDNGVIVFTQADVSNGSITPGDTPGFPVTITVGGSYRLGSTLIVTSAVNGIEVRANEVTIDMGGFTLAGSGAGRNGIASFNRSLRIYDGTVRGFTNDGVRSVDLSLTVVQMTVANNGRTGVFADSTGKTAFDLAFANVVDSRIINNAKDGVSCAKDCRVVNSVVSANGDKGVYFRASGGLALGNTVTRNTGAGIHFSGSGGAGNNTVLDNAAGVEGLQISGVYLPMQPNACEPVCPAP